MADVADSSSKEVAVSINDEEINKSSSGSGQRRRWSVLHRVPPQVRGDEKLMYEPQAVPLGPYHHGRVPEFRLAEQLKDELLDMVVCGDDDRARFLLGKISERVVDIRNFYGGAAGYGDEALAEMMLRDTCFVFCFMKHLPDYERVIFERLGLSGVLLMSSDVLMLENQIPLWLLSWFQSLLTWVDDAQSVLFQYLNDNNFDRIPGAQLPWGNGGGEEPLHLLGAMHRISLHLVHSSDGHAQATKPTKTGSTLVIQSRSATDLRAKGIHFRASSRSMADVKFFSFATYGELHIPVVRISHNSKAFLSNAVAFEMTSDVTIDLGIIRHVNFMKTLIRKIEDVQLLREKGILYNSLATDEETVAMFRDMNTLGLSYQQFFGDIMLRIEEHCNNKGKTWLAELINTYFRSPLTSIALFAAAFILVLTFLQTFYTINPRYTNGR